MLTLDGNNQGGPEDDLFCEAGGSTKLPLIERITVLYPEFKAAIDAVNNCLKSSGSAGETICAYVLAPAGCGKTHISNRFLRLYPEYRHKGQLIVPILRVRVPSDPTVKGLSTAILERYHDPIAAKGSDQQMADRIDHYIPRCQTRVVILEEMQHFVDADSEKRNTKLTNWLKIRIEETSSPFVVMGLPRTKVLFDHDDQLKDRFNGPFLLKPFIWFEHGETPALANRPFKSYLHHLSASMPFIDCMDFGAGDNPLRFFCASRGVQRRIGKLLKQAAILAEEAKSETLDLGTFEQAYDIRTGQRLGRRENPFSKDFDLIKAEGTLRVEAARPTKF